jgi:hypothetical protein
MTAFCRFCGKDVSRMHWVHRDAMVCGDPLCSAAASAELAWVESRGPDGERTKEAADAMHASAERARSHGE